MKLYIMALHLPKTSDLPAYKNIYYMKLKKIIIYLFLIYVCLCFACMFCLIYVRVLDILELELQTVTSITATWVLGRAASAVNP